MALESATTLAEVIDYAGSNRFLRIRAKRALNLGANTMVTSLDIGSFLLQSMVGNDPLKGPVTQRKPDMGHAQKMAIFIFKGLVNYTLDRYRQANRDIPSEIDLIGRYLGSQPYYAWAPVVASIRDDVHNIGVEVVAGDEGEVILKLRSNQMLWVIDGQHRRIAWKIVLDYVNQLIRDRKYTKSGGLVPAELKQVADDALLFWHEALAYYSERFSITIDLHFGLTTEQEKQLFHDLNNLQKTVAASQAQAFDQSNPINIFTHRLIEHELFAEVKDRVTFDGRVDWEDSAWIKLDTLNAINARLLMNKTTISGAKPVEINDREDAAWSFWEAVTKIPSIFNRNESVAAQPALLKALARVYFELTWGRGADAAVAESFLENIPRIDFSHNNPLWNIEQLTDEEVAAHDGLAPFLPENWREKSVGGKIDGIIRFGMRHNESILVLPGVIRYLAKLPPSTPSTRKTGRDEAGVTTSPAERKALNALLKIGMSEEDARASLQQVKTTAAEPEEPSAE